MSYYRYLGQPRLVQGRHTRSSRPRISAVLVGLVVLCLLLLVWWLASNSYKARLIADQRGLVASHLYSYAQAVSQKLNKQYDLLEALRAFVLVEEEEKHELGVEADAFIRELVGRSDSVRSVTLAPGGVTRWTYPSVGSPVTLSRRAVRDERRRVEEDEDMELAIRSRRVTMSSTRVLQQDDEPQPDDDLEQDAELWVAWLAVYRGNTFWGLVAAELDPLPILGIANPDLRPAGLELTIRNVSGGIVYGSSRLFDADPVVHHIDLPGGHWDVAGVPAGGWDASVRAPLQAFQFGGLAVVGLLTSLAGLVANRQSRLALAVEDRGREISRIDEALALDIARRRELEAVLRETRRSLSTLMSSLPGMAYRCRNREDRAMEFVSEGCSDLTGYSPAELVESGVVHYAQLVHPHDQERVWNEIQDAVSAGRPFRCFYRIIPASTTVRWVLDQGRGVADHGGEVFALEGFVAGLTLQPALALEMIRRLDGPPTSQPATSPLTGREEEVLRLLADGLSNQQIADVLVLSERTVRNHVSSILTKLHLKSRTQAALHALQAGLPHSEHHPG